MNQNGGTGGRAVTGNFFWRFAERVLAQLVAFAVSVVLAKVLGPSASGTVALIAVFTTILQVFVDSGLGNALIQKKDADDTDFTTVFYTNVVFCIVLYAAVFFGAPLIAGLYENAELVPYIRVLGLTVLISGVKNVQQAYVARQMMFRKFFFATLCGTVLAGITGIAMAYAGLGIWALVAQQVINLSVDTLVLWITVKWRPVGKFSAERLKTLFSYGWKLLVSALLDTGYSNLRQLIIGKKYSSEDLAFYNLGEKFPSLIVSNINTSIDSVLLPTMSREQEDRERVRAMTRRAITVSTYIMAPLMIGLACVSEPLIHLLLGEEWMPTVFFIRVFCIAYLFHPVHTANLNAIKAMGRSDLFLRLEIMKKSIGLVLLLVTMQISVAAMAYSVLASTVTSQLINAGPNRKLLGYSYLSQLKDLLPNILTALAMGGCVYGIGCLGLSDAVTIVLQVAAGAGIYIGLSAALKNESYVYVLSMVKDFLQRRKHGPDAGKNAGIE